MDTAATLDPSVDYVNVEWVGLPSPYSYPDVQKELGRPRRTRSERMELRLIRQELQRQEIRRQMQGYARFTGQAQHHMGVVHGLSQDYYWGPHQFIVPMVAADVDILMRMNPMHALAFKVHQVVVVVR